MQKFPFDDPERLNWAFSNKKIHPVSTVIPLAKRFPQLDLADDQVLDDLRVEFTDFQLSPGDLPSLVYTRQQMGRTSLAVVFSGVKYRTDDEQPRFGLLFKLVSGLVSIPCSLTYGT